MSIVLTLVLFLVVVGGLIAFGVRAWRGRDQEEENGGLDLIPYLLLALAVGVAGFSLAGLASAGLTPDRLAGRPTGEIAAALAGLVVAAPTAYFLWRRQARRRRAQPHTPGWPIYLGAIELVFLTAVFVAVRKLAQALTSAAITADWPDVIVYGGIVSFHWWAETREPPHGEVGELPRLIGSGVSLIALTSGAIGTLGWLFSEAFDSLFGLIRIPDPAVPLALTLVAVPIWAWRWLPVWAEESNVFRNLYLGFVSALSLTMTIGAGVTMIATLITFLAGQAGRAQEHFRLYPPALAFVIVGGAVWYHHRRRLGPRRTGALRGYQYVMAATGLTTLVGSATALINFVFEPTLAGNGTDGVMIALGCTVIASGWAWIWFWRKAQAAPRHEETHAVPRRIYLIGMTVVLGLTAAGALIGALVVVFRALLGEDGATSDGLRLPVTLTATSGVAAWHLFTHIRADGSELKGTEIRPFTVTVICSHPGNLGTLFPKEATVRVMYRADAAGIVDDEMAPAIVSAVGGASALVWVDDSGFRVAAARAS